MDANGFMQGVIIICTPHVYLHGYSAGFYQCIQVSRFKFARVDRSIREYACQGAAGQPLTQAHPLLCLTRPCRIAARICSTLPSALRIPAYVRGCGVPRMLRHCADTISEGEEAERSFGWSVEGCQPTSAFSVGRGLETRGDQANRQKFHRVR